MALLKAADAAKHYGVALSTVRLWARNEQIPVQRIGNGHYRYVVQQNAPVVKDTTNNVLTGYIIYTRVSSRKQQDDLKRQSSWLQKRYPRYQLVTDIGSGINYTRPGFKAILESLFKGNVKQVVVAHKDRFSRFGFDFFTWIFSQFGAELVAVENQSTIRNTTIELAQDLMEVITVFSARYHGRRKYTMHKKVKILPKQSSITTLQ
jgi:predicted site-specific integrase-resolvase